MTWHQVLGRTLLAISAVLVVSDRATSQSNSPRPGTWVVDKQVQGLRWVNDDLYVAGEFTRVGPQTGGAAPIDLASGELTPGFPVVDGRVFSVEPDGGGGWYLGGDFDHVGGIPRRNLAHVFADFTVDPTWDPGAGNQVTGLHLVESTLYVRGLFFDDLGGENRKYLGALDAATGLVTSWNPDVSFRPSAMAELDGVLYIGGNFTTVDGQPRQRLAAFDRSTGLLNDWDPQANNEVIALATDAGIVYAGGRFTQIGDSSRAYLAGLDPISGALTPWAPEPSNRVNEIVVADNTLYIGGSFSSVGGTLRTALAEVDKTTGAPTGFDCEWTGNVNSIALHGDTLFVGGSHAFLPAVVVRETFVAAFSRSSGLRIDWDPAAHDEVQDMGVIDGTLMVAGDFESIGGVDRFFVAALDSETGEATDWKPQLNRRAFHVAATASGDTIYVGGSFHSIDGTPRTSLAAFETATGSLLPWSPDIDDDVREIIIDGETIYVGGSVNAIGGLPRIGVGAIDRATGAPTAFNAMIDPGSFVNAIALSGDTLFVGGSFDMLGNSTRIALAAVDKTTGALFDWDPAPDGAPIEEILVVDHPSYPDGVVFVGGDFNQIGGQFRFGLAALDRVTGQAYSWNPSLQEGFSREVHAMELSGTTMFIGGIFSGIRFNESANLGAVDIVNASIEVPWTPDASGWVWALALGDSTIAAGGNFTEIGDRGRSRIAEFSLESNAPLPPTDLVATLSQTDDKVITLGWTESPSAGVNGYLIYRSTSAIVDTSGLQLASTGVTTSHVDVTPSYDTYFYRIFARNAEGDVSTASNEASAESPDHLAPASPAGLSGTAGNEEISISWSPNTEDDFLEYRIFLDSMPNPTTQVATAGSILDTSRVIGSLVNDTTYYVRLTAVDVRSNESGYSNEIELTPGPQATTAILQNPALSSHVDVTVVSDLELEEPPTVTLEVVGLPAPMEVPMRSIDGSSTTYLGSHVFTVGGTYTIDTGVVPVDGDPASFSREFVVVHGNPAFAVVVPSTDDLATLRIPENAITSRVFFLSEVIPERDPLSESEHPTYRFGPARRFPGSTVEIRYDPSRYSEPGKLRIQHEEAGIWIDLPSSVYTDVHEVRARTERTGRFRLVYDELAPGDATVPPAFLVLPNHPNPFRPATTIEYALPDGGPVRIGVYDPLGRRVATLVDGHRDAGRHAVVWRGRSDDGKEVAGGIYFVRVAAGARVSVQKMTLLR